MSRWALLVGLICVGVLGLSSGDEAARVGADLRSLAARPPAATAWRLLGQADMEEFLAFCRRRIPPEGVVVSIAAQPADGYYRATYDLYPRTVWPYVSPLGLDANVPHPLTRARLEGVLAGTHARYLAVWHVELPRPLPPSRWVAVFAPGEYVVALR